MGTIKLDIQQRDNSKNPRQLRNDGFLPATVYGKGVDSTSVQLNKQEFLNAYNKDKEADFELKLDSKTIKAEIAQIQYHYASGQIQNIEFKIAG